MKDAVTIQLSNRKLLPLIQYVREHDGAAGEVLKRLSRRTRKKWNIENVHRWLNNDPAKRTQPLFGVGLLLVKIGEELGA